MSHPLSPYGTMGSTDSVPPGRAGCGSCQLLCGKGGAKGTRVEEEFRGSGWRGGFSAECREIDAPILERRPQPWIPGKEKPMTVFRFVVALICVAASSSDASSQSAGAAAAPTKNVIH